jgi:ATP-dependent exoDNAse (exonuclease V) beta subunit
VPLVRSFRSHRQLVDGCNALFSQLLTRDVTSVAGEYQIEYEEPMEAERADSPADLPSLELLLLNRDVYGEDENVSDQCRRWEAYEIAARLRHMIKVEGRLIYDKQLRQTRQMGYGDAGLLFRALTDVNLYEDVFKAADLPS